MSVHWLQFTLTSVARFTILDEADRMLEVGFAEDVGKSGTVQAHAHVSSTEEILSSAYSSDRKPQVGTMLLVSGRLT